jgi:23S rRNA (uracil1939-C5)-methyltransferase
MKRRKKEKSFVIENIKVESFAAEGKCIARYNEKVVFIEGVVAPGDVIDIQITKERNNYMEGKPVAYHVLSTMRTQPFCQHFGICGGCKWQHIPYETQTIQKQQQVTDNLQRIGKVILPDIQPILPSAQTTFYRNKLEFTFSDSRWLTSEEIASGNEFNRNALGFHIPGRYDKILDINHCYLQADPSNEIRLAVKKYAIENNFSFFNQYKMQGFLRNLIIRTTSTGELMVIVQLAENQPESIEKLMTFVRDSFPQITSLHYVINTKGNDTFFDLEVINFAGKDHILEKMENLKFRIGPKSFYQTNSEQAFELYKITRQLAGLQGTETVYDLYTGTGTIALFVANQAKKVVGLEYVAMAVEDAKLNAQLNGISHADFFAGDMKNILTTEFIAWHGKPDVIITDPPRAGMDAEVVTTILQASPEKIVYVSCNPATQARDLALLDEKYYVSYVQPVDMFPHTYHVENVVLLEKRKV